MGGGLRRLTKLGYERRLCSQRAAEPGERLLHGAHPAASNLMAWMPGTHCDVSDEHLPFYPKEYVFRHNRHHTPDDSVPDDTGLAGRHPPTTYRQLVIRTSQAA